jgi:hypothetical protein
MSRLWVTGRDAGRNLDVLLTFAVAGVLANRIFLVITGYPQLGNGTLHISHAIWGGVMMLVALVFAVASIAPGAPLFVAIVGGAGFGWFVDELGKYITRDVDYFFKPTLALIYTIFIVMYFAFRGLRRNRDETQAALLNAVEAMRHGILGRLDEPRRAEALSMLQTVSVDNRSGAQLQDILIELETVPAKERRSTQLLHSARAHLEHLAGRPTFPIFFGGVFVLLAMNDAAQVVDQAFFGPGVHSVSEWAITVTCLVTFVFAVIGVVVMYRSRLTGYKWLEASLLVSILITQIFLFHEAQFEAVVDLAFTLVFWMILRAAVDVQESVDSVDPAMV